MSIHTFISTTGQGIARASRDENGQWQVERLLEGEDVRCLACDPLDNSGVYAGTRGRGGRWSSDRGKSGTGVGRGGKSWGVPALLHPGMRGLKFQYFGLAKAFSGSFGGFRLARDHRPTLGL